MSQSLRGSVICLILWAVTPSTIAVSCENMVRLADLQDIIKNQTKLIEDLYHVIEDQKNMMENQATFIGYQTDLNEKLKMKLENSSIDVYFKTTINEDQTFPRNSAIEWGNVLENVGGGYHANTGKFVTPVGGTYRFTVTVMNKDGGDRAYMQIRHNESALCTAQARGGGTQHQTGVCSRVARLEVGDAVWVINPHWSSTNRYHRGYTTFEGFLFHVKL